MSEMLSPIELYTYTYPQLTLPVRPGEKESEEYIAITRKCIFPHELVFPLGETGSEEIIGIDTPAGRVEALYLPDRNIFERFVRVLGYRCEPVDIPKSTGAMMISGINNLRKYMAGEAEYKDTVLLISKGDYSNVSSKEAGFEQEEWTDISKRIRLYHEATHFISRKLYLDHKEAIRDELIADFVGIIGALGYYDSALERTVIGIYNDNGTLKAAENGRIRNYESDESFGNVVRYCEEMICRLEDLYNNNKDTICDYISTKECRKNYDPVFNWVLAVEDAYI